MRTNTESYGPGGCKRVTWRECQRLSRIKPGPFGTSRATTDSGTGGCNWTGDFDEEFRKRRGYDIIPYLPFILRVGRLGAVVDPAYGASKSGTFADEITRVRFDFELTKAELLYERFTLTRLRMVRNLWCEIEVAGIRSWILSLESSLGYDIPGVRAGQQLA
ncbi:MAG: glycosyl hydrolase [Bacteroidales bacterium]